MPPPKHPPQWIEPFLAALARTGNVRVSAEAAGVDVTTTYNRRARYPGFREAWAKVLGEREVRAALRDDEQASQSLGGDRNLLISTGSVPPQDEREGAGVPRLRSGSTELVLVPRTGASGAQLARVGTSRWSEAAEERFLVTLAATANVKRAAAAAGFSQEAIYRRRLKHPAFREAWEAALDSGKARLEMMLVEAAQKSFDPDCLPIPGEAEAAKVSVGEALHILKIRGGSGAADERKARGLGSRRQMFGGRVARMTDEEVEREFAKAVTVAVGRHRAKLIEDGWCVHDGQMVPPGWVREE